MLSDDLFYLLAIEIESEDVPWNNIFGHLVSVLELDFGLGMNIIELVLKLEDHCKLGLLHYVVIG